MLYASFESPRTYADLRMLDDLAERETACTFISTPVEIAIRQHNRNTCRSYFAG